MAQSSSQVLRSRLLIGLFCLMLSVVISSSCSDREASPSTQELPGRKMSSGPNIVLLLFDDAGYSDMSAFGGEIQTPNIERVAREGMTVKRFYTTARCSPTRAGILSGRYPHDVGMADLAGPNFKTGFSAYQGQLPLGIPLVSELLQGAGYRTYLQGKWHLGTIPGTESISASDSPPNRRGFDEFIGFLGAMAPPYPSVWHRPYQHNDDVIKNDEGWYSIARLNEEMMKLLRHQFKTEPDRPFFVYFAAQAPHDPLQGPQDLVDKYRKIYDRPLEDIWQERVARMRKMGFLTPEAPVTMPQFTSLDVEGVHSTAAIRAAMIESTDAEFGKLLQLLEDSGKLDNTLIIIASDNGATTTTSRLTNAPFIGAKGVLHEGGTLSPLVARWPAGNIKANGMTDEVTTYLDLMPTFLQVAGVAYPASWQDGTPLSPLEGRNVMPLLRGEKLPPPDNVFWNLYGQSAVLHNGKWKLLVNSAYNEDKERNQAAPVLELYDLESDPAETKNLVNEERDLASTLLVNYQEWAGQHGAIPFYQVLDAYKLIPNGGGHRKQEQ